MSFIPPTRAAREISQRPIIRRTRSWRGIMHVRFNDSRVDRNKLARQAFMWAPIRIFGLGATITAALYFSLGHDVFLQTLMGYESEMLYETRVNPGQEQLYGTMIDKDRAWKSPLRSLEKPLHKKPEFDVLRDPKST